MRSEVVTPAAAARPVRRSVALRLRYKECNGDLAGGSFVELAKTLADGLTFSDRVQFARVVTQPLLVEAEAIIARRSFPRGGPLRAAGDGDDRVSPWPFYWTGADGGAGGLG